MRKKQQVSEEENTNEGGRENRCEEENTGKGGRDNRYVRKSMEKNRGRGEPTKVKKRKPMD